MDHLRHPFDDAFFAALARNAGVDVGDLPEEYDPGYDWGNDSLGTVLPGMPNFSFIPGDGAWFGRMALHLPEMTYRRLDGDTAEIEIPMLLSETHCAALAGRRLAAVIAAPEIGDWTVISACPDPNDDEGTVLNVRVPSRKAAGLCQTA